jgi:hypothetical protein
MNNKLAKIVIDEINKKANMSLVDTVTYKLGDREIIVKVYAQDRIYKAVFYDKQNPDNIHVYKDKISLGLKEFKNKALHYVDMVLAY